MTLAEEYLGPKNAFKCWCQDFKMRCIARVTQINMYVENYIRTIMLSTYQDV